MVQALESVLHLSDVSVTSVRDWREQTYDTAGTQDAWVWETVQGRNYGTRKPHFDFFVVASPEVDRQGAQIVSLALAQEKVVLGFNQKTQVLVVTSLREQKQEGGGWAVWGNPIGGHNA